MQGWRPIFRFKSPALTTPPADDGPFHQELERFAATDPRWRFAIETAAARLSPAAQCTLGVALSGLEAGPAPRLMAFGFGPDDEEAMRRESRHMSPVILSALGLLIPAGLGLDSSEVAHVQGIVTAVHRLLRIAKTRP